MNEKKLYRSTEDRRIAGVCGGLGEYMNVDPTIIRLLAVLAGLFSGIGLLMYIAAVLIIPNDPGYIDGIANEMKE